MYILGIWASGKQKEQVLAASMTGSPYIRAYPWSSSGFGTKYADPATIPPSGAAGLNFSQSKNEIAYCSTGSPYITGSQNPRNTQQFLSELSDFNLDR